MWNITRTRVDLLEEIKGFDYEYRIPVEQWLKTGLLGLGVCHITGAIITLNFILV